ncbi:MAG: UDP-N-acetylmuramate--L-alanine ligase [Bacillota bacterium]
MSLPAGVKQVHFIGIGGYGMSALALVLLEQGYPVSGSDLKQSALTKDLGKKGATVFSGHHPGNLGEAELVVYSTAVPADNPELAEARSRGLLLWHRSEMLAALLNSAYGIAVAGAHGKTTTTAMTALLLEAGGLDPTAIVGGVVPAYGSNARLGKSGYLVAEADESDRSFTRYFPQVALVTGIEADHLEHYDHDYSRLQEAYRVFLNNLAEKGTAVLCAEDPALIGLSANLKRRVVTYALTGQGSGAEPTRPDYYAAKLKIKERGSLFDFYYQGKPLAKQVELNTPGRHNILNAVGALALACELGLEPRGCAGALKSFTGVGRRFEIIGTAGDITVVDDYAHHPTEIKATLSAAHPKNGRLICLFQPHRYSRTAAFFDDFAGSFDAVDCLFLHEVYSAGEKPVPGATSGELAGRISQKSDIDVFYSEDLAVLEKKAAETARPGDLIITMGAGDITASAPRILNRLQEKGGTV